MQVSKKSRSTAVSLPAPVGGWNARDPLGSMSPKDAVTLNNFWPRTADVQVRKGYTRHATGFIAQVQSMMAYSGTNTNKLFAASGSTIHNITTGGAIGAADVTGLGNAKFEYVNFATSGGNYMLCVNGADKLRGYTGTAWYTDGDGTANITGVDTAACTQINVHKTRIWLVQANTLLMWYLPVNAIGGAATSFPLQSIARKGGYIVAMGTWTIDAGYGVDDMAAFITSKGEVIIYRGTDPSSASTWALVGVYEIGSPVSRRCFLKWQGDLILITHDGIVPMSAALQSSRVNPRVALSNKIQSAVSLATTTYATNFGWCMRYYAKANMLILNIPVTDGNLQQQYVMNTITKSWAQFDGWNANCWEIFNDEPYFGANGYAGKAWDGTSDHTSNIDATGKQAFNYFGERGKLKRWTMVRPVIQTNGSPNLNMTLDVDFGDEGSTATLAYTAVGTIWDTAVWDTDLWAGGLVIQKSWQGVNGVGYCAAPRLQTASQGIEVYWAASDIVMEPGGTL